MIIGTIKINIHPNFDYSVAVVTNGFSSELGEYVKNTDWLMWEYPRKRQIRIDRIDGTELQQFIDFVKSIGFDVYTRDERDDEWAAA